MCTDSPPVSRAVIQWVSRGYLSVPNMDELVHAIRPGDEARPVSTESPVLMEDLPLTVAEPRQGWSGFGLGSLWRFRELLYFLVWRDVKVRYKQTAVGIAWVALQPLLNVILFSVIFGRLAKLPSEGIPYPAFSYAGMLAWTLFSASLSQASGSVVANKALITRVFFPRLIIPIAGVLAALVDFGVAAVLLGGMMAYYGIAPGLSLLAFPAFMLLALAAALAVGIWLAALNVQYRDVQYAMPFLTQFWLFATPIAYSATLIPERFRVIYGLNPMAGVVEGFRWSLFSRSDPPGPMIGVSAAVVVLLLVTGLVYFRRMERTFADVV